MATLYTIGYQGASLDAFVERLRAAGVTVLVDVRDAARSRKKGFSKRALDAASRDAGIAYEHWRQLGAPPEMRRALAETGDRAAFLAAYAERLAAREEVLDALAVRLAGEVGCLMCYERDATDCHRSRVSGRLVETGRVARVTHL